MRITEKDSPRSQTVNIGSLRLWMTTKATDPIIQVVDGNKQNIWPC
jgi:hypothetical protein